MGSCGFQYDVALCLYTVTGWGVMPCVCGMEFLCGSTLVKEQLLKAGIVNITSDVKAMLSPNKQTLVSEIESEEYANDDVSKYPLA